MNNQKHICFIVPGYSYNGSATFTFVTELVHQIADSGIKCTVIAPQSLSKRIIRKSKKRPKKWQDKTNANNVIDVYQPYTISFSNLRVLKYSLSSVISDWVIKRKFKKLKLDPDLLYAHFWHSGVTAGEIGKKNNIPYFVATGESRIWVNKLYPSKKIHKALSQLSGVIAVSTKNKEESLSLGLASTEKFKVVPNAINPNKFYPMNQENTRASLGFPQNAFIVAFTGAFSERKGIQQLSSVLETIEGAKGIYMGSGPLEPKGNHVLFEGSVSHDEVVKYLNAADVFVLPSSAEGSSNAIIEAMACGLPIISSNASFNDDILNEENSIRVEIGSHKQLREAIIKIKDNNSLKNTMTQASIKQSKTLTLSQRAKKIINFLETPINK